MDEYERKRLIEAQRAEAKWAEAFSGKTVKGSYSHITAGSKPGYPPAGNMSKARQALSERRQRALDEKVIVHCRLADKGMTTSEAASRLGVTPAAVSKFAKRHGIAFKDGRKPD